MDAGADFAARFQVWCLRDAEQVYTADKDFKGRLSEKLLRAKQKCNVPPDS